MKKENDLIKKWLPIFITAALLIVFYKLLSNLGEVMGVIGNFLRIVSPFLFGILICYFLYKPCKKLEEALVEVKTPFIAKRARVFSVLAIYLIVILVIILFMMFVVPIVIASLIDLASNIPVYYQYVLDFINGLPTGDFDVKAYLMDFANNTLSHLFNPAVIEQITRSILGLASGVINTVLALIVSLYLLLDRDNILAFFKRIFSTLFKEKSGKQANKYLVQINKVLFTFIASKGLDSIINWLVVTTILLVFNVKYAFLLGLLAGLANFIPYLGSLVAVIVISLLTLLTGGVSLALQVFIALAIFQQIDGNFIEPRIMGTTLKISPILVIFSVIVGGAYFGILGMFFAVPIATILKQLLIEYMDSKPARGIIINKAE